MGWSASPPTMATTSTGLPSGISRKRQDRHVRQVRREQARQRAARDRRGDDGEAAALAEQRPGDLADRLDDALAEARLDRVDGALAGADRLVEQAFEAGVERHHRQRHPHRHDGLDDQRADPLADRLDQLDRIGSRRARRRPSPRRCGGNPSAARLRRAARGTGAAIAARLQRLRRQVRRRAAARFP